MFRQLTLFAGVGRRKVYRPATPHVHTETSRQAAEAVRPIASELERRVYQYLASCGILGATDEQIQEALGMDGNSERPRRKSLEQKGYVRDSGLKRPTRSGRLATVWVVTEKPFPLSEPTDATTPAR